MIKNTINAANYTRTGLLNSLRIVGIASSVLLISACGSKLVRNPEAERVQRDLVELRADRNLATQSPVSLQEAEKAVQLALTPERDKALSEHRVYIADRKVQTARSLAQAQYATEQRKALSAQSNEIRLNARTLEAEAAKREANARAQEAMMATSDANAARDQASMALSEANRAKQEAQALAMEAGDARTQAEMARSQAEMARSESELSKSDADMARIDAEIARKAAEKALAEANLAKSETNAALDAADQAKRKNDALMLELADLQAKTTERGVQLTLGDVLFSTGKADLKAGSAAKLDQLVKALASVPERGILIEGFTDSVGSDAMNMVLSQNRANTVSSYLTSKGVPASKITAVGKGETLPVAGNEIAAGRQLNRRVEVTIENPKN